MRENRRFQFRVFLLNWLPMIKGHSQSDYLLIVGRGENGWLEFRVFLLNRIPDKEASLPYYLLIEDIKDTVGRLGEALKE